MEEHTETMEVTQEQVEAAWNEPADQPEAARQTDPEHQDGAAEREEQENAPSQQEGGAAADQPERFTLKNRDETRQVTREELVALAQKGWDYDKVRQERDQLRAAQARQSRPLPGIGPLLRQVKEEGAARQREVERFYRTYPQVDPSRIPPQVWDGVRSGDSLTDAYTRYENGRLKQELAAMQQNERNRSLSPGSLSGVSGRELDEIDRLWAQED